MAADELRIEKVAVTGPTLAALLHRFSAATGDVDGLLFGHLSRLPQPEALDDDDPSASSSYSSSTAASATVTGHLCFGSPMSFFDPVGRVDPVRLHRASSAAGDGFLLGWLSGRRRSPLRPSMRELAVSLSLAKTLALNSGDGLPAPFSHQRPLLFLLLSSSATPNLSVHTHEYKAFVFRTTPGGGGALEPKSLDIVNVGPAFRGQYSSFSPESALPRMPCPRGVMEEGEKGGRKAESLVGLWQAAREQRVLDCSAEGFGLERLGRLVGPAAAEYTAELEDLYGKTLHRLEGLARAVEKTSAKVLDQENRNLILRSKIAGLE